jgi:hypothetical protein
MVAGMDQIQEDILAFLANPNGTGTAARVVEAGEAAFDRILHYSGPYPEGSHPLDCWDDLLVPMLGRIGSRWPDILRKHLANPDPDRISTVIIATIVSKDPRFTDLLITHLDSRSYYCIDLVLGAMQKHEYLQVEPAIPYLQKLLAGKRINHLMTKREEIEALLARIQSK